MRFMLVGLLALSGCAGLQKGVPFTAPDGRQGYSLSCPSMSYCYNVARELCGGNYDVLDQNERTYFIPADPIAGMSAESGVARSMSVACKA